MEKMLGNWLPPPAAGVTAPPFPVFPLFPLPEPVPPSPGSWGTQPLKTRPVGVCTRWARCCASCLIHLVVQRGTQRRIGGEVSHHQRDNGDRPDREQESEPQRHSSCPAGGLRLSEGVADEADGVDERWPELLELLCAGS